MTRVRAWLRANVWALLAVVVLGTGATLYAFAFDWQHYQDINPTQIVDVPRGEAGRLGPGTFALEDIVLLEGASDDGRRYDVPEGTDVVVADVRVTPDEGNDPDDYVTCDFFLRQPTTDGEREWWIDSSNPTSYPEPEQDQFGCNLAAPEPYTFRIYVTVPAGGAEGSYLLVTVSEALPRALRLL